MGIGCDAGSLDINRVFKEADLNHDGRIDFQDFCGMMKGKQLVSDNATYVSKKKQSLPTRISSMLRFPSFDRGASDLSHPNTSLDFREKIKKETIMEQYGENETDYDASKNSEKGVELPEKKEELETKSPEIESLDQRSIPSPGTPSLLEEKAFMYSRKENPNYDGSKVSYPSPLSIENDDDDKTLIKVDETKEHRSDHSYGSDSKTPHIQFGPGENSHENFDNQNEKNSKRIDYSLDDIQYLDSPTSLNSPSYPTFDAYSSDGGNKTPTNI